MPTLGPMLNDEQPHGQHLEDLPPFDSRRRCQPGATVAALRGGRGEDLIGAWCWSGWCRGGRAVHRPSCWCGGAGSWCGERRAGP